MAMIYGLSALAIVAIFIWLLRMRRWKSWFIGLGIYAVVLTCIIFQMSLEDFSNCEPPECIPLPRHIYFYGAIFYSGGFSLFLSAASLFLDGRKKQPDLQEVF